MSKSSSTQSPSYDGYACQWVPLKKKYYVDYHDTEWGVPVTHDRKHFEMLILEGAQAGLSWDTVLRMRQGYRDAFHNFDPKKVAAMTDDELEALRENPNIIRNRLKIYAARTNAQAFLKIQDEYGSFNSYIWSMMGGRQQVNAWKELSEIPAKTRKSDRIAKDLKRLGMTFVGSTIIYAYLQACGLINDHTTNCWRYKSCIEK